ncbi:DUF4159 domain-containing protein [Poseidonocella sedimentorum]|uniref:N-terminal double-transmembrane domain-containing protein n=1 Tax=Poseidonocella sedimentorum TaxID=871652 RepID=A0A1I6EBU8_9RHOB|nr:DUF4159 domain-containing protein [Poseidonocella sedimentorum]SFR15185.1 N-terminal double-transmembrane domain-containing protein [Poseidonocella sedimentorum]
MLTLGPLGFLAPGLLLALIALPVLWILLRAVPPAPMRRLFPGVALLLGLEDEDTVTDRTPWWLLLLRMLAVAAVIVGLAGPVLNPETQSGRSGPLLIASDASWAGAPQAAQRRERVRDLVLEAGRAGRPVALLRLSAPEPVQFQAADAVLPRVPGMIPEPWSVESAQVDAALEALDELDAHETIWLSDGRAYAGQDALRAAFQSAGALRVIETGAPVHGLLPARFEDGALVLRARRSLARGGEEAPVAAFGRDPAGIERVLAEGVLTFEDGATEAELTLALPAELRARLTRFELMGGRSAGRVALADDSLQRREVALIAGRENREGLELLAPLHYLRQALEPSAELLDGALLDILPANPDVIVLADVATLAPAEADAVAEWVEAGGLLLRFAGPRLAASELSREVEDPLMPVRLRAGGRTVGGAMSWGAPKALAPFPDESPFFGLTIPEDVTVSSQVMAQPDPTLAERVIAQLTDGTPLVTAKPLGQGRVVLFHVTANAEWSNLPLSGLFVEMLERLSVSARASRPTAEDLAGTVWKPVQVLDGAGRLLDAGTMPGIDGAALVEDPLGPALPPGLYEGAERRIALNVMREDTALAPAVWPADVPVEGLDVAQEQPLKGWLLALAMALLGADAVASLALSGRLPGRRLSAGLAVFAALSFPVEGRAQEAGASASDDFAIAATSEVVLAHVLTGDAAVDRTAEAGLFGLSQTLFFRTSIEPAAPMGVDLERDELAFFPFLYWPVTADQPLPSDLAYARLNAYLRTGGMILFDTRDADVAGYGGASPEARRLQQIAAPLDLPPLEPLPEDHVLTRAFYLLQDFPGRHNGRAVWVEAAPPDAEQIEGMPFRNLNDNVTPVVIGGNDWAAAWAMDERGTPLYPVGRGYAGERQREIALRFGVNLVMHVLTGNYKSDQVHVPALLDRLGQ